MRAVATSASGLAVGIALTLVGCGGTTSSNCGPKCTSGTGGSSGADAATPNPSTGGAAPTTDASAMDVSSPANAPPEFGGLLDAQAAGDDSILVSWSNAVDDATPPDRMVYDVAWGETIGFTPDWGAATRSPFGATSVVVDKLPAPDTTYYFVGRALDEAGNIGNNGHVVAGKTGPDSTAPKFAGCSQVFEASYETLGVEWEPATDNGTPAADIVYEIWIQRAELSTYLRTTVPAKTVVGGTRVTLDGLTTGTEYEILCGAKDAKGNRDTNRNLVTAATKTDETPPIFVGVATAVAGAATGTVQLTWSPAADNGTEGPGIVYAVYEATAPGQEDFSVPPLLVTDPGATSVTVIGLSTRTTHYFVVRARDHTGNEDRNVNEASAHLPTSFSLDVQPIFTEKCALAPCHTFGTDGTNPPIQALNLDPGYAYDNIVDVPAREGVSINESIMRVARPSTDPMESYLWRKIQIPKLTNIYGGTEPPAQFTQLTEVERQVITDWILEGANYN